MIGSQLELLSSPRGPARRHGSITDAGEEAMRAIIAHAGRVFREQAIGFVLSYLRRNGPSSGEDITDSCKAAGITPHDDRAFGWVYRHLALRGEIVKAGNCDRRKGHGTSGGNVWKAAG